MLKPESVIADFETLPLSVKDCLRVFWMLISNGKLKLTVTMLNPNVYFTKSHNKKNGVES